MAGFVAEFHMQQLRDQPPAKFPAEEAQWLRSKAVFRTYEEASGYAGELAMLMHDVRATRIIGTRDKATHSRRESDGRVGYL